MKAKLIALFDPADSSVTDFDLKHLPGNSGENNPECAFWTRSDECLGIQYLLFCPDQDRFYPPRIHSEYALFICLAGGLSIRQSGATHLIGPGEAMISNGGVEHTVRCLSRQSHCEIVCLTFDRHLLAALAVDFQLPPPVGETCPAFTGTVASQSLHHCALEIKGELRNRAAGYKLALETLAQRLLVETFRSWPRSQIQTIPVTFAPRLTHRDFIRAYEFMRGCRKETFRLRNLCNFLGTSEERFTRLFLAATNQTPANFYNRMLLERGRELLRNPALSIKEIGFELGFKTASHFIASFRREFAATPQGYREQDGLGAPALPASHRRNLSRFSQSPRQWLLD